MTGGSFPRKVCDGRCVCVPFWKAGCGQGGGDLVWWTGDGREGVNEKKGEKMGERGAGLPTHCMRPLILFPAKSHGPYGPWPLARVYAFCTPYTISSVIYVLFTGTQLVDVAVHIRVHACKCTTTLFEITERCTT